MKRVLIALLFTAPASALRAACGLSVCDLPSHADASWRAEARFSQVAYDLDGHAGSYVQTALAADYGGFAGWRLAATASLISNSPDQGHHKTGLGNPVLLVERSWGAWAAGSLAELPLGDDEHGLAVDHVAALPYVAWRPKLGAWGEWTADLRAGYSYSFESGHGSHGGHGAGDHDGVLVVSPHEDKEFVYRAAAARRSRGVLWGVFLDGQHALDGATKGMGFLTAGTSMDVQVGRAFTAGVVFEVPVSRPRRMESRVALRAGMAF